MFAARGGFLYQEATVPIGNFGNSAYWSPSSYLAYYLYRTSTNDMIDWKATSGFTVEFWIYAGQWPGTINPGPGNHDNNGTNYWSFGPSVDGRLEFYYWAPGQTYITTNTNALSLNTWHNVCAVFTTTGSDTTITFYIDGVRQQVQLNDSGSFADSQTINNGVFSTATPFMFGAYGFAYTNVYIDNLRVSNINRYSGASYTLATAPFTSDGNTQLLVICDGPNGSTSFTDSSSFNHTITNNGDFVYISDARANHS